MLFNFALVSLTHIKPWGEPGDERLHWFGLTDSQYWIEVGKLRLLEYSEEARRLGTHRYCDYQAARLYEDVIDLAGHALEPIPSDLDAFITGHGRRRTLALLSAWCDEHRASVDDPAWSIVDTALACIGKRELDTGYLTPSADIFMWSDESMVHVEWDNRDRLIDGTPAWTAQVGSYALPRSEFIAECRSFHERLMHAMSERVDQVMAGALSPAIRVDFEGLLREHEQRSQLSPLNFGALPSPTDWTAVREAMALIGA